MLSEFLDFLLYRVSPPFLCGAGGMTIFAVIGSLDCFLNRSWMEFKDKIRHQRQYMKGVVVRSYNGIQSILVANDLLVPRIKNADEVLIKVMAAGVDRIDVKICHGYGRVLRSWIQGYNKESYSGFPVILGRDCAGVVIATGNEVSNVKEGDHVWAVSSYCQEGMMAEYVAVKESQVALMPVKLTFEEAASLPYISVVTWNALINQAHLGPNATAGKRILVHASNTPYGLFAVQVLKAWGGHVTATVPTAGLPMCRILRFDDVIVYSVTDFEKELRNKKKFDIVLNTVGTALHSFSLEMCAKGGKVITIITTPIISDKYGCFVGSFLALAQHLCLWVRKVAFGIASHMWWENIAFNNGALKEVHNLIQQNKIQPVIEEYSIERAEEAFQQLTYKAVGRPIISFRQHQIDYNLTTRNIQNALSTESPF